MLGTRMREKERNAWNENERNGQRIEVLVDTFFVKRNCCRQHSFRDDS